MLVVQYYCSAASELCLIYEPIYRSLQKFWLPAAVGTVYRLSDLGSMTRGLLDSVTICTIAIAAVLACLGCSRLWWGTLSWFGSMCGAACLLLLAHCHVLGCTSCGTFTIRPQYCCRVAHCTESVFGLAYLHSWVF